MFRSEEYKRPSAVTSLAHFDQAKENEARGKTFRRTTGKFETVQR